MLSQRVARLQRLSSLEDLQPHEYAPQGSASGPVSGIVEHAAAGLMYKTHDSGGAAWLHLDCWEAWS